MPLINSLKTWLTVGALGATLLPQELPTHQQPHTVLVSSPKVEARIGGMVSEEYTRAHNIITLRGDLPDTTNYFRHRTDVNFALSYKQDGESFFDGFLGMCSTVNWRDEDIFTRIQPEQIAIMTESATGLDIKTEKTHEHRIKTPLIFMREGWLDLQVDKATDILQNFPTNFKIGYFPYRLGRGLSLGASDEGGIHYMGFEQYDRGFPHSPLLAPGFKLRVTLLDNVDVEAYFSKWRETLSNPWFDNGHQHYNRLDRAEEKPWGRQSDRDVWAGKAMLNTDIGNLGHLYTEPYILQMHSRMHKIEIEADSIMTLGAMGLMMNFKNSNWHINGEVAVQWGSQLMHPIDRNHTMIAKNSSGNIVQQYSHIFLENRTMVDATDTANPESNPIANATTGLSRTLVNATLMNSTNANLDLPNVAVNDTNRNINRQNKPLLTNDGTSILARNSGNTAFLTPTQVGALAAGYYQFNNAGPENIMGGQRFRPKYRVNFDGFMALCDAGFTADSKAWSVNGAVGYLSGDNYPYANETNHNYKGFIPLRDRTYNGLLVISKAMFDLRWLPRPINIDEKTLTAYNNDAELTDLMLLGLGTRLNPFEKRDVFTFGVNALLFWNNAPLKKWNKSGTYQDATYEEFRNYLAQSLNFDFNGWTSTQKARHYLGAEFNCSVDYKITEDCLLNGWMFMFMPGDVYRDLEIGRASL